MKAAHAVAAIRAGLVFDHVTAVADPDEEIDGALHWTELQNSGDVAMSEASIRDGLAGGSLRGSPRPDGCASIGYSQALPPLTTARLWHHSA